MYLCTYVLKKYVILQAELKNIVNVQSSIIHKEVSA